VGDVTKHGQSQVKPQRSDCRLLFRLTQGVKGLKTSF
jgi:hypothetical protein